MGESAFGRLIAASSLILSTLLDGIPESFILGLSVATGGNVGAADLAAIFVPK